MAIGYDSSTCSTIHTPEHCDIDPATGRREACFMHWHWLSAV
eukprot:COSAG06_NODE_15183_length_1091_cov_3.303427_2_plen_41_part_01